MIKELQFEFEKSPFPASYGGLTEKEVSLAESIYLKHRDVIGAELMNSIRKAEQNTLGLNTQMYFKIPVDILENTGNVHFLEFYIRELNEETVFIKLCKVIPKEIEA